MKPQKVMTLVVAVIATKTHFFIQTYNKKFSKYTLN